MKVKQLVWAEEYNSGIGQIDYQHKKLLTIINQLNLTYKVDNEKSTLNGILSSVKKYAACHFEVEEYMMLKLQYKDYSQHVLLHAKFLDKVHYFDKAINKCDYSENLSDIQVEMIRYLNEWFEVHMLSEVKAIKNVRLERGVKIDNLITQCFDDSDNISLN